VLVRANNRTPIQPEMQTRVAYSRKLFASDFALFALRVNLKIQFGNFSV